MASVISMEDAREGLANGTFSAYGPAATRLYATLDDGQMVAIKSAYQLDQYADRIAGISLGGAIQIRKA